MASLRTPTRPGGVDSGASAATSTPRRATPKAKLNLSFSKTAATPRSSARKPLRVVADTNRTQAVDITKILNGVYAMVDVRLGADAEIDCSDAVAKKLADMGATIMKKKSGRLTHVVLSHFTPQWKEKVAKWHSISTPVEVVSQLWVNACFTNKQRMKESAFFPVNKGFDTAVMTPGRHTSGSSGTRVSRQMSLRETISGARKHHTPATPLKSLLLSSKAPSSGEPSSSTPQEPSRQLASATPTGRTGVTNARKRRALSMEPMASDAILRLLESSTKKLMRQHSESDVSAARVNTSVEEPKTPPVKTGARASKVSTPPLTVRLKAAIERRKSLHSSSSPELAILQLGQAISHPNPGNLCVSERSPDDAEPRSQNDAIRDTKAGPPSAETSNRHDSSQGSLSLNILSPVVAIKNEWTCSICSCMNVKTRRVCKGCNVSRVAAKTSASEITPARRPSLRSASTTPRRQNSISKFALPSDSDTPGPSSASARKHLDTLQNPPKPTKRRRLSSPAEGIVTRTNDTVTENHLGSSTPSAKKHHVPPSTTKRTLAQRAVIGITGVDSETRGIIECAVHGIDANMAGEAGYRKSRVVKSVDYAAGVTHLIVGREVKRTIKVLFAIARGAWIVSERWAFTSLEKERWLNEEAFEISAFPSRASRLHPEQRQVFRSLKFFVGSKMDPSREVMMSLIQCAGGEIANQISVADYCICGDETLFRRASRTQIVGVSPKWVFDSIANLKLADPQFYTLNQSTSALEDKQTAF